MREEAWLEFYRGKWCLLTARVGDKRRTWTDEKVALEQLTGEGRDIDGPHPERESRLGFRGYALSRMVQ